MNDVNSLVQRLATLLAEIEDLGRSARGRTELELLASTHLVRVSFTHEERARRLLRGLVRSKNVAQSADLRIITKSSAQWQILPVLPGYFVINLSPVPAGGFHMDRVIKAPVIAWKISDGYAEPIIPGMGIGDRWAVLDPAGLVSMDPESCLFGEWPVPLKSWIRGEIEWFESCMPDSSSPATPSSSISPRLFNFSGPVPRALWFMMSARREWWGTSEELLEALTRFRDDRFVTGWPSSPTDLLQALEGLSTILAFVGLSVALTEHNDRLHISRLTSEDIQGGRSGPMQ